ncbi:hypothetical protein ACFOG5_19325 [Pedobacter fastidiosus]
MLISLNFYLLFSFSKKFERQYLLKLFPAMIPIVIVLFFGFGFALKLLHIQMNFVTSETLISAMMSLIVISLINFVNQFFSYIVDLVVTFHQKKNAANLGRHPIKFFVDNQIMLKRVTTLIWFFGSALMLYGIWLGG